MDMAHILGGFAKWAATLLLFGFSIALSVMFFQAITPPDKPWFAYAALGLTEGGLALWMIVFRLMRHEPVLKSIALVMVVACAVCSAVVAGTQFYLMLATHYDVTINNQIYQVVSMLLEVMFGLHLGAFLIEMIAGYFANPANTFRGTPALPPTPSPHYQITEQQQRDQPKEAERTFEQRATVKALPPAQSSGPGFWQSLTGLFSRRVQQQPAAVAALSPVEDEDDKKYGKTVIMREWLRLYRESGDAGTVSFPQWMKEMKVGLFDDDDSDDDEPSKK